MPDQSIPNDTLWHWIEVAAGLVYTTACGVVGYFVHKHDKEQGEMRADMATQRQDITALQKTEAACVASKAERERLYDDRDKQRGELVKRVICLEEKVDGTRDIVMKIAGHLGINE